MLKKIGQFVEKVFGFLANFLAPEEGRLSKLLSLSPHLLKSLLPKSNLDNKEVWVLFDYQNKMVKLLVKSLKYKNNPAVRKLLAGVLYEEMLEIVSDISAFEGSMPVIVAMPMSEKEKRQRGFNQCEEILQEMQKMSGGNILFAHNCLLKIKDTEKQAKLNRGQRLQNVKDSMIATPKIRGQVVIVFDDVYTTGASFTEARRALHAAGAKRVFGLFLAH